MSAELKLRPKQLELIEQLRESYNAGHDRVILQAPTGFGKTTCFTYLAQSCLSLGSKTYVFAHLKELIDQICARFDLYGIPYGRMQAGGHLRPWEQIQVCSIQTFIRRLDGIEKPDVLIFDESHHCCANQYVKVMDWAQGAHTLGVTATPQRLDGKGLNSVGYTDLILGPSLDYLINNGDLCPVKCYTPECALDPAKLHSRFGDYIPSEAINAVEDAKIIGCAVEQYLKICPGTSFVAFYASVAHAKEGAEKFRAAGVSCEVIYGDMPKQEREELFKRFERKEILGLANCNLISEGVDVPGIETVINCKPSKSLVFFLQSVGRGLRTLAGKTHCTYIDLTRSITEFGLPTRDRLWSLDGKVVSGELKSKQCRKCFLWCAQNARQCDNCGESFAIGGGARGAREITTADGQLLLIEDEAELLKAQAKKELSKALGRARTYEDLLKIAYERNYSPGWARVQWQRIKQRNWGK